MRVFWNELKKLLNWRLLLILVIFTGLFYYMFLNFDLIDCYPNGHSAAESVELGRRLAAKYGLLLDAREQAEFETVDYPAIEQAANRELAGIKEFRDAGVTTMEAFDALGDKKDDVSQKLYHQLDAAWQNTVPMSPACPDDLFMYQEARDTVIPQIDTVRKTVPQERVDPTSTGAARVRAVELETRKTDAGLPILPWATQSSWRTMMQSLLTLLLFTVAILVSPNPVAERLSGVRNIAYSCRKGRSLFFVQFGASMTAAVLAEAAQLAFFFTVCFTGPHRVDRAFLGADSSEGSWWNMTFGQSIVWTCAVLFLLSFGFAMVGFAVSRFCKNYIAVLAAQVPLTFAATKLGGGFLSSLFEYTRPQYYDPLVCALCVLAPLALCLLLVRREKKTDILA